MIAKHVIDAIVDSMTASRREMDGSKQLADCMADFLVYGYEQDRLPGESFSEFMDRYSTLFSCPECSEAGDV